MKCYFRIGDRDWIKGQIEGQHQIVVEKVDEQGFHVEVTLDAPSFMFALPDRFIITGYNHVGDGAYSLVSVDISPGWRKPAH